MSTGTALKHHGDNNDDVDIKGLSAAANADQQEHDATVWQAFLTHKKAVFWSMALSGAYVSTWHSVCEASSQ